MLDFDLRAVDPPKAEANQDVKPLDASDAHAKGKSNHEARSPDTSSPSIPGRPLSDASSADNVEGTLTDTPAAAPSATDISSPILEPPQIPGFIANPCAGLPAHGGQNGITRGQTTGSRYQELFQAKMAAEHAQSGGGDGAISGNSTGSIPMDTRQTSQSSSGRPASNDEQWSRAIGSADLQGVADRMRQSQTLSNSYSAMGGNGAYGQASRSDQHAGKPSASSIGGSDIGSPRIGSQQQGWIMQGQGASGSGRPRQVSGDGSFNPGPPEGSPRQPMSAPPTQSTFDHSHSQAAFANQNGAKIPATVPAYRPQFQQSAYFQRMMAAKLAADPNMRSDQSQQQQNSFAWMNDGSDAGSTSTASGLGNGMQQFLPSTTSPMFHMVNAGSSEHGQAHSVDNGSNLSLSSAGSHHNLASPAMGGQSQPNMAPYGQQAGGSRPLPYSPQPQDDANSQAQTPSMAYTAGLAGQNQFYNQVKREPNGGMPPQSDSARFAMGPPMSGYPSQQMPPQPAAFPGMRMASTSSGQDQSQGGMPYKSESTSQRVDGELVPNNGEGSNSRDHGDNGQSNGSGGDGGDGSSKRIGSDKDTPKKAVLACHFCRGRKLKCDGARPSCSHCVRRNLSCSYDAVIRRRGPGKKKKTQDPNASVDSAGGGDEDGEVAPKKPVEGKKRGRKPKDPNAPPKPSAQLQMPPQPFPPQPFHAPPHPAYGYGAMPPGMEAPPMHYPMHHPYATMHYGPPPPGFHMGPGPGPEPYIDPALQGDRRMDFAPGPPPGMDHRYDYGSYGYMPRQPPPPSEDEHLAKRARYGPESNMGQ